MHQFLAGQEFTSLEAMNAAIMANAFVPAYLVGAKALPRMLPAYVGMGDANEAICYVSTAMGDWDTTLGALEWLIKGMALVLAETATRPPLTWPRF